MRPLLLASLAAAIVAGACAAGPAKAADVLAGTYVGKGSGAGLEPLQALTKRFSALHPGAVFDLEDFSSDGATALVASDQADFGFIGRELYPQEVGKVASVPMTVTGTAVAVNPANPVTGLTTDQVRRIFIGQITDWGAVGGLAGHPIRIVLREATSSTRLGFESYFYPEGKPRFPSQAIEVLESREMYAALRDLQDSIGMVTLQKATQEDQTIRLLALDGVQATINSLNNGTYPIRRPVYLITSPDPAKVKPGVRALMEFIRGPEGQQILSGF